MAAWRQQKAICDIDQLPECQPDKATEGSCCILPPRPLTTEEELADVIIYALEFANMTGIDAAAAIERKMAANAKKYPVEKARGRSDKYTEL